MATIDDLIALIEKQANVIVSTGTGGGRFDDFDADYQKDHRRVCAMCGTLGVKPPFPWTSLWEWHGFYKQELQTYASRRQYVQQLKSETLNQLFQLQRGNQIHDPASSDLWSDITTRIERLVDEYSRAQNIDDWQDVGRRSREILKDFGIALSKLLEPPTPAPRDGDAKAWFDLFLEKYAAGRSRAELRALMRAAWELAQKVTHADVDAVDAFAAGQATVLVVRTSQMLLESGGEPDNDEPPF